MSKKGGPTFIPPTKKIGLPIAGAALELATGFETFALEFEFEFTFKFEFELELELLILLETGAGLGKLFTLLVTREGVGEEGMELLFVEIAWMEGKVGLCAMFGVVDLGMVVGAAGDKERFAKAEAVIEGMLAEEEAVEGPSFFVKLRSCSRCAERRVYRAIMGLSY